MERSYHQKKVQRALEGNERVWFHPTKNLLAVWYGGVHVALVDSKSFVTTEEFTVKARKSISEQEDEVVMEMARRGFDRVGRSQDDTRVTES